MFDHGYFFSYEGHKERRTGKIRGAFSRMHRALDGWMLACAPASKAQGLHHHGPRYFNFYFFCTMYVCVYVFVFFPSILDIKFVGRTSRGRTGGKSHRISNPPSFCGAWLNFSREKDSAIPFPRRP